MNYQSKPHKVNAFKFTDTKITPPKWFILRWEEGKASITIDGDNSYITLYSRSGQNFSRVEIGEYVVEDEEGIVFGMDGKSFEEKFEPVRAPVNPSIEEVDGEETSETAAA